MNSIEPLYRACKLCALLAQFPPSFKNDSYGQQIRGAVIRTFGNYPIAVELRHRSWSDGGNTARLLRENNVSWVQIDELKFSSSIAAEVPLTSDFAYFRFHGRNVEMWWQGYAPRNAVDLQKALRLPFKDLPITKELSEDGGNK